MVRTRHIFHDREESAGLPGPGSVSKMALRINPRSLQPCEDNHSEYHEATQRATAAGGSDDARSISRERLSIVHTSGGTTPPPHTQGGDFEGGASQSAPLTSGSSPQATEASGVISSGSSGGGTRTPDTRIMIPLL